MAPVRTGWQQRQGSSAARSTRPATLRAAAAPIGNRQLGRVLACAAEGRIPSRALLQSPNVAAIAASTAARSPQLLRQSRGSSARGSRGPDPAALGDQQLLELEWVLTELVQTAEEYKMERELGPLSILAPGDATAGFVGGLADWVKPRGSGVGSAIAATGRAILSVPAFIVGTPSAMLVDTLDSTRKNVMRTLPWAPAGSRLSKEGERQARALLRAAREELASRNLTPMRPQRSRGKSSAPEPMVPTTRAPGAPTRDQPAGTHVTSSAQLLHR